MGGCHGSAPPSGDKLGLGSATVTTPHSSRPSSNGQRNSLDVGNGQRRQYDINGGHCGSFEVRLGRADPLPAVVQASQPTAPCSGRCCGGDAPEQALCVCCLVSLTKLQLERITPREFAMSVLRQQTSGEAKSDSTQDKAHSGSDQGWEGASPFTSNELAAHLSDWQIDPRGGVVVLHLLNQALSFSFNIDFVLVEGLAGRRGTGCLCQFDPGCCCGGERASRPKRPPAEMEFLKLPD